jgi:hypothetical protein
VLSLRYLAEKTSYLAETGRPAWNGEVETLEEAVGVPRQQAYATLKEHLGQSGPEVTELLWDTYEPQRIWLYFAAIGVASAVSLLIFNQRAKRWGKMNA